ncbi:MAG: hypothetical protein HC801_07615 [Nitrospira sp.]|nr:hypothetical protein [Nitrospira sp.]
MSFLKPRGRIFRKFRWGVAGIDHVGGPESPEGRAKLGSRIEEVLKADVRRSLVFSLVDLSNFGIKAGGRGGEPDPSFKQAAENGVSVIVWGKAGMKADIKTPDVSMDGYVYDAGSDEVVGGNGMRVRRRWSG